MSETKKTAAASAVETTPAAASAPKFTVERLRRDCLALFGATISTYVGATHGLKDDAKYTVEEMKAHIDKWKNTQVNPAGKKEGK